MSTASESEAYLYINHGPFCNEFSGAKHLRAVAALAAPLKIHFTRAYCFNPIYHPFLQKQIIYLIKFCGAILYKKWQITSKMFTMEHTAVLKSSKRLKVQGTVHLKLKNKMFKVSITVCLKR